MYTLAEFVHLWTSYPEKSPNDLFIDFFYICKIFQVKAYIMMAIILKRDWGNSSISYATLHSCNFLICCII